MRSTATHVFVLLFFVVASFFFFCRPRCLLACGLINCVSSCCTWGFEHRALELGDMHIFFLSATAIYHSRNCKTLRVGDVGVPLAARTEGSPPLSGGSHAPNEDVITTLSHKSEPTPNPFLRRYARDWLGWGGHRFFFFFLFARC